MKIQIRPGLEIGDSCPPFIIAEVGSNWRNLDDCLLSIEKAKECGADAVKFQAFTHEALYGMRKSLSYEAINQAEMACRPGMFPERPPIAKGELLLSWLPELKEKADHCGIEFMCSAFSPELVAAVDPFVNIHKVASSEMCHVRILEKLRQIGKPVFMSTGAHGVEEIRRSFEFLAMGDLAFNPGLHVVLMYCVSAYPAKEVNLVKIEVLRRTFHTLVGYSDHSIDVLEIPFHSIEMGACVVEKHFTTTDANTPDRPHSLNPDQFKRMVAFIRGKVEPLLDPPPEESPMILRHNRRLIATKVIHCGDTFEENNNFGIFRSLKDDTHAFSPFKIDEVNGKKAKREIQVGDGIGEGDV